MKKIIPLLIFVLVVFIVSNYNTFIKKNNFETANDLYVDKWYSWALNNYNKALNLDHIKTGYNIWNSLYRLWEQQEDIQNKKDYYIKSILSYSGVLNYIENKWFKQDIDVVYNYNFVLKKLKELEKEEKKQEQQEKEEKEEKNNNNNDWEENDNNQWNSGEEKSEDNNWDEKKEPQKSPIDFVDLSEQNLEEIKKYIEKLEMEEEGNRQFYNNSTEHIDKTFFDSLFDKQWEKDW